MATTSKDMAARERLLTSHALVVKEEGSLGLRSTEELKDIVCHHFNFRKHEFYAYRSYPHPFIIIFAERHAQDVVFAAGKIIDGPVELRFKGWELDEFGDRAIIPYHIRLCIEGIPQHAWTQEIADRVLCDEAVIHHVEENSRRKIDLRAYQCWAFSKDPSKIPQVVFLTLTEHEANLSRDAQIYFARPRGVKHAHVFKVIIHVDVVEDLLFYHHQRAELIADGKVPWRELEWQYGVPDGDLQEDKSFTPARRCAPISEPRRYPSGDEDRDRDHKRLKPRGFMNKVSSWMEGCSRNRSKPCEDRTRDGWYRGESSRTRMMGPYDLEEGQFQNSENSLLVSDTIEITPQAELDMGYADRDTVGLSSDVILITPGPIPHHIISRSAQVLNSDEIKNQGQKTISEGQTHESKKPVGSSAPSYGQDSADPNNTQSDTAPAEPSTALKCTQVQTNIMPLNETDPVDTINIPHSGPTGDQASTELQEHNNTVLPSMVANVSPTASSLSPLHIGSAIKEQGRDLHELLQMFRQANSEPLSSFILQIPKHKKAADEPQLKQPPNNLKQKKQRKSPRLQEQRPKGKSVLKKAQELIARKCGIVEEDEDFDSMALQQYVEMYKQSLTKESMEAIEKLTEVTSDKQKKDRKEKRVKKEGKQKAKRSFMASAAMAAVGEAELSL
jgi:hypothetical protein